MKLTKEQLERIRRHLLGIVRVIEEVLAQEVITH